MCKRDIESGKFNGSAISEYNEHFSESRLTR